MGLIDKEKFGLNKDSDENQPSCHQSGSSTDFQMGLVHSSSTSIDTCQRNQMGASLFPLVPMVDSFCSTLWDHQSNAQRSSFPLDGSSSDNVHVIKPIPEPSRLDMAWNPSDDKSKDIGALPQSNSGLLPHNLGLSQFPPPDLAFIERAARFSCYGGVSFSSLRSPDDSSNPYLNSRGEDGYAGTQPQRDDSRMGEHSTNPSFMIDGSQRSNVGCSINSQKDIVSSQDLGGHGETQLTGSWHDEDPPSFNGLTAKKRKRNPQEMEIDHANKEESSQQMLETSKDKNGTQLKDKQNNSSLGVIKNNGKQPMDATDPPKEDYIHVRARRGQATNSHSLAERVRREKISERMKFLQDLVPGCSKVTGKAVMLDEIINYVQSLQRQVEFLSMKLATVNPSLDNIEGLQSKNMFQCQSTIGFSQDLAHSFLNPTSHNLLQSGISGVGPSADVFRKVMNAQLVAMNSFKDVKNQMPNSWDDDLHNVLSQMAFGSNLPLSIQESNDKACDGFPI